MDVDVEVIYCQSNEKLRIPRPWLLSDPPKMLFSTAALDPVACMDARHGMETELSHGKMYAGMISYTAIPANAYQNQRNGFEFFKSSQCRVCRTLITGILVQ